MRVVGRWTVLLAAGWSVTLVLAQGGASRISRDHPAIQYSSGTPADAVARLNRRLLSGAARLSFDNPRAHLHSVLAALEISSASQVLVYSETSLQSDRISPAAPRALYFNDAVAVGWVKGSDLLEVAAHDPVLGVNFYTLERQVQARPQFERSSRCLECHLANETGLVPGVFTMSQLPLSDNKHEYAQGWAVDHRTPIEDRWGGWYVTGPQVPVKHLGNVPVSHVPRSYVRAAVAPKLASGGTAFDASAYLSPHSDVVALLVLNHQLHAMNLMTRLGWEARIAAKDAAGRPPPGVPTRVVETARELADYLLFVDEAPLPSAVRGASGFAAEFAARGPRDAKGRSLRDLDLERRLLRYPCSYMVYSEAFDTLPPAAKSALYDRMWEILAGQDKDPVYARLSAADRRAIIEILRATKKDLPASYR
jgi:hypothetical protein